MKNIVVQFDTTKGELLFHFGEQTYSMNKFVTSSDGTCWQSVITEVGQKQLAKISVNSITN